MANADLGNLGSSNLSKLEKWIFGIQSASSICDISPQIIEGIIRTESNYCKYKINKKSSARGCMQIIKSNLTETEYKRVKIDDWYSIKKGVELLCKFKKSYPRTYIRRYYAGTGKLEGKIGHDSMIYEKKVLDFSQNKYYKTQIGENDVFINSKK